MALEVTNVVPGPGELNPDGDAARWVRIAADLEVDVGFVPFIWARLRDNPHAWFVVYDGVAGAGTPELGFAPLFRDHGTVSQLGQVYSFSLLPVGGWWGSPVEIFLGQFQEAPWV